MSKDKTYNTAMDVIKRVTGRDNLPETITIKEAIDAMYAYTAQNFSHSELAAHGGFYSGTQGVMCNGCQSNKVLLTPEEYHVCLECGMEF